MSKWLKIDLIMSPKYCLPVPVFHFWPILTHPAARSFCDSWVSCSGSRTPDGSDGATRMNRSVSNSARNNSVSDFGDLAAFRNGCGSEASAIENWGKTQCYKLQRRDWRHGLKWVYSYKLTFSLYEPTSGRLYIWYGIQLRGLWQIRGSVKIQQHQNRSPFENVCRARVPSTLAQFAGLTSCWYTHYASK